MDQKQIAIEQFKSMLAKEKAEWTKANRDWGAIPALIDMAYVVVVDGLCMTSTEKGYVPGFCKAGPTGLVGAAMFTRESAQRVADEANRQTGGNETWHVVYYRNYPAMRLIEIDAMAKYLGITLE